MFFSCLQVKGIGKCGYYRLPTDEEPDEETEEKEEVRNNILKNNYLFFQNR